MSDPNVNTQAEILANVRNKALDDALACYSPDDTATDWADKIRALKTEEK